MDYLGDYLPAKTVRCWFDTQAMDGSGSTLSSITVKVYKDSSLTTEVTTGVTTTADADSLTGINLVEIDLSTDGTFYAAGHDYAIILTAGTLATIGIKRVLGQFSISNRSVGAPASASGLAADVASVKTDTGTTIPGLLPSALAADGSIKASLQSILGSAFTEGAGGRIAAAFKQFFNIATPAATMDHGILVDTVTTATTVTNLTNAPTSGDFTATMKTSLNAATPAVTVSDKTGFSLSGAGVQAIWDALTSALTTVGSIGKLLVTNIDAAISSRLASGSYTAPDNASITAIKAKTDNLPANPSAVSDIPTANQNADALLDRANAIETGLTPRGAMRLSAAAEAGKISGAAGTTVTIRNAVADSKDRITATVDTNGNRTAVTTDVT